MKNFEDSQWYTNGDDALGSLKKEKQCNCFTLQNNQCLERKEQESKISFKSLNVVGKVIMEKEGHLDC